MFGRNKIKKVVEEKKISKPISKEEAIALAFIISKGGELFDVLFKATVGVAEAVSNGNIATVEEFMVRYKITKKGYKALADYKKSAG